MADTIHTPMSPARLQEMLGWQAQWQPNWQCLAEANGRMMQGMMALFQHQMQLAQKLATESYADVEAYRGSDKTPASATQQVALAQKRFHNTLTAMRELSDEAWDCCFETASIAAGAVPALDPGKVVGMSDKPARKAAA